MRRVLAASLFSLAAQVVQAAPQDFVATYDVSRDGKVIASATLSLHDNGDGTASLITETHGSAGLARMLGLDVREETRLRWHGDKPESIAYDYRQDAAIKRKQRHADFDWDAKQAEVSEGDKRYRYAIAPGTVDRHGLTLALGAGVARGATALDVPVAVKDRVEPQHYEARPAETVEVPAGRFGAVPVERTDAANRRIRSWFADGRIAPVRIEQPQGDGSTIVMELRSFRRDGDLRRPAAAQPH